jgi:hypothetical protein
MTYFHYYATTSRNLDRVLQYGVFPVAFITGAAYFKRREAALNFARVVSAGCYSLLTSAFFGLESDMIDGNGRTAVSAEMGLEPDKIRFSDYKLSDNIIISKAYDDIKRLQKYRYGSDAMFLLPLAVQLGSKVSGVPRIGTREFRTKDPITGADKLTNATVPQIVMDISNLWDYGVYAGKSAYWGLETYFVDKSSHYEVVKLRETLESTGKDIDFNDLLGVYQRTRADRKRPLIAKNDQETYDALRPLFKKMADAYNKHDGKFGMPEIVYLIGLDKISVHGPDHKIISAEAIARSEHEIDRVIAIGLAGIRQENKKLRTQHPNASAFHSSRKKNFFDELTDAAFKVTQVGIGAFRGGSMKRPEEYITVRDPGELTSWSTDINR